MYSDQRTVVIDVTPEVKIQSASVSPGIAIEPRAGHCDNDVGNCSGDEKENSVGA